MPVVNPSPGSNRDEPLPREGQPDLERLKRWPDACRSDLACEVAGILYPAPDDLTSEDALWWIDFVQLRTSAPRSLVNNVTAAGIGAFDLGRNR